MVASPSPPLLAARRLGLVLALSLAAAATAAAQQPEPDIMALAAAVRGALPFPDASPDGELPADDSAASRWFVVWPGPEDDRVHVKANPLHPDTQKAGAAAMAQITAEVMAAERRAQAAYDKALEELRRTGNVSGIESITLDDEGLAGERIDAELELVIELAPADSYELASAERPVVAAGAGGPAWVVTVPPNVYRAAAGGDAREHFRPAEARLLFGLSQPPAVSEPRDAHYRVSVAAEPGAFAVVLRGNEPLLRQVLAEADWQRLARR